MKEGTTVEKVIQALHHEGTIISKLIEEVVVQNLPVETQKYLALTSLLDRFNEDLVQSLILVLDDPDVSKEKGKKLIKSSLEQNLFLIQLDTGGEWYRYHHLFQSQIKSHAGKHFSKEVIQQLYKETSKWFQSKNILEEAIKYAILSEDLDYAVKLFANNRLSLHNTEQFQRLERLINMFPKEAINNSMEILLSLAILQDHKADFQTMQKYLDLAGRIQNDHTIENKRSNQLKGQFYSVSSYLSFMQGDFNRTIKQSIVALELLPESEPNYFREFLLAFFSMAYPTI